MGTTAKKTADFLHSGKPNSYGRAQRRIIERELKKTNKNITKEEVNQFIAEQLNNND